MDFMVYVYGFSVRILWIYTDMDLIRAYLLFALSVAAWPHPAFLCIPKHRRVAGIYTLSWAGGMWHHSKTDTLFCRDLCEEMRLR
jgi:hypothetical protein